jgi:hypothetical protein
VRGENEESVSLSHSPRLNDDRVRRAVETSAAMSAISFCIARAEGAPSDSFAAIVSARSSRTVSYWAARPGSAASARSTISASRRLSVPAACHGRRASTSSRSAALFLNIAFMANLFPLPLP